MHDKKSGRLVSYPASRSLLIPESFFENPQCHISEKPFRFTPKAAPAHECCRVTLRVFVSDLSAVVVSADDQLPLASGFVGDIEWEDSPIHFEVHPLFRESVVESPAPDRVKPVLNNASVFDSDFLKILQDIIRIPFGYDAIPNFRCSRSRAAGGLREWP